MDINAYQSLGYERLSSLEVATALTIPAGTAFCVFNCEDQDVRWRDDGTDPTIAIGMLCKTTDTPYIYYGQLPRLKFIQAVVAGAAINVTYYGSRA